MEDGKTCFDKYGNGQSKLERVGFAMRNGGTPLDEVGHLNRNKYRCGMEYRKQDVAKCYDMISEVIIDPSLAIATDPVSSIVSSVGKMVTSVKDLANMLRKK